MDIIVYVGVVAGVLLLKPFVIELIDVIDKLIKKKTETGDEESLIQEVVPMVKVDPIEVSIVSRNRQNRNLNSGICHL